MEFPDDFFKDKLLNSEAEYGENVTFEKVMQRRRKKRRFFFWWNPKTYATFGVLFLGILTAFVTHSFYGKSNESDKVQLANVNIHNSTANQLNQFETELSAKNSIYKESGVKSNIVKADNSKSELAIDNSSDKLAIKKAKSIKKESHKSLLNSSNSKFLNQLVLEKAINDQSISKKSYLIDKVLEESTFAKNSNWAVEDIFNWSKWNDRIYSAKLKQNQFGFDDLNLDIYDLEFDLPDFEIKLRNTPSKWFAELSVITGSNNTIVFKEDLPLSVLGTQYMAQYQMLILKDFANGSMFGAGIQFSEWVGNGRWQSTTNSMVPKVTTHKVLISAPWQPKKYAVLSDTTYVPATTVQTGVIDYKIDKVSFPLAYRFFTSIGKLPVRFGVHLAPGYTTLTQGVYFTQTDFRPIQSSRQMTLDGRITLGPIFPITKKWTFVMEPSLIYQSFVTPDNQVNGKFFTGLGVAILHQF